MSIFFVTGIDTDIGKTFITGLMAKYLKDKGQKVITQKLVQTGCDKVSDDILLHRKIMGNGLLDIDIDGTTCPYIFKYPASPHLSAKLENQYIESDFINNCTNILSKKYEFVLVEGVGGLMVPLNGTFKIIDHVEKEKFPVIVVTSPKLGSINHTLLSLEALINRNIDIAGIVYNNFQDERKEIIQDSKEVFMNFLENANLKVPLMEVPFFKEENTPDIDFSDVFKI